MATLILTAVGTIVGGPIGGAIGAFVGQQIDQQIFAPKGRQGPRLGDLSVQTSRYGQPIPKLFGRMRVAGTVIWATELQEQSQTSGGGKGRPKVTTYTYSVSFAVALSARTIRSVGRIWADGKLLRGAAGDWKSETGFRLYLGGEDQTLDPLLGAAEGSGATPAYRGLAYAVFEDMQLADYGNRIPSITFEVIADAEAPSIGRIADVLSGGLIADEADDVVAGYAASGDSLRAAIEPLARVSGLTLVEAEGGLRLRAAAGAALVLPRQELGAGPGGERRARREIERESSGTIPDALQLLYYEPARDFQAGVQHARRNGPGRRAESIELAAALDAASAKAMAEAGLGRRWTERSRAVVRVPWRRLGAMPGAIVDLDDGSRWRVAGMSVERAAVELKLVALSPPTAITGAGSPGRPLAAPDLLHGPTVLALLDLPPLSDAAEVTPRLWVAAAGAEAGWRRAALLSTLDGGASWQPLGSTAAPAVMGEALTVLAPGGASLFDSGSVEIQLLHADMTLEGRTDDALVAGANLAMLGAELIQFGVAEALGGGRYRLARLLRGRRGTEQASAGHGAGERFVLLDADTLAEVPLTLAYLGQTVEVMGVGIGDGGGAAVADAVAQGAALRPPSPVHLRAARLADGTVRIGWTRRSRIGWAWLSEQDTPLGEASERYRVTIVPSSGASRTLEVATAGYDYSPADQAADGSTASALDIGVRQLGSIAPSLPASITLDP